MQITPLTASEQKAVFSKNLKYQLALHAKTQIEVSKAINVNPTTFNNWCTGLAFPRMGKVQALADYFGILKSQLIDPQDYSGAKEPPSRSLTSSEQHLLDLYNKLNPIGQEEATKRVDELTQISKYTDSAERGGSQSYA